MNTYALPITLLLIALIVDLYVALLAWVRRRIPGGHALFFLMLAVSVWTVFTLFELRAGTLPLKILFSQYGYIGSQTCPVFFLILVISFTGQRTRLPSKTIPLLFIVPVITIILAFTNQYHGWIWSSFTPYPGQEGLIQYGHGVAYWIFAIGYSYVCLVTGAILIIRNIVTQKYTYRWQSISILLATTLPWIGNLMYITRINPFPGIDVGPIAFSFGGMIVALSILRFRLLDITPVARDVLFEKMVDGLIVLDPKDRIVDINPSALQLVQTTYQKCVGISAAELLNSQFIDLLELDPSIKRESEIKWGDHQEKILDVTVIPILDKNNKITGRLLVSKDVTDKQIMKNKLQEVNTTLQEQLNQINILQVTLREQAIRDPLTGLYNRRFLDDILACQISQAQRDNTPISLVMIDLDNFKRFNDTYGHSAGDAVIKNLSTILKTKTRQGDFACRFGGEEFLVVMPGATLSASMRRTEEWRKEFQENPVFYENRLIYNTFSAGVATYPFHAQTQEGLIKAADKGLYLAKNSGRNRVSNLEIDAIDVPTYHPTDKII